MAKNHGGQPGNEKGLGELWSRLKFLLLAIFIYRLGTHIPVPGLDPHRHYALYFSFYYYADDVGGFALFGSNKKRR